MSCYVQWIAHYWNQRRASIVCIGAYTSVARATFSPTETISSYGSDLTFYTKLMSSINFMAIIPSPGKCSCGYAPARWT